MSSMDKRAALVWLIAVASAIGLWVLMTGGPALAEEMLMEVCVEEGSYLNLRAGPGLAYDVEMELEPGNRLSVLETRGEWALVVWDRLAGLSEPLEAWAGTAEPELQRAQGGEGPRPKTSGEQAWCMHSMSRPEGRTCEPRQMLNISRRYKRNARTDLRPLRRGD